MPINISYQPPASTFAGLGLAAGLGEYAKYQQQQRMEQARMQMQAAQAAQQQQLAYAQMANQNQQRQQQNFFEASMLPQKAMIDAQQHAFQSNLAGANQQRLAELQGQIHADQSAMDLDEAQRLQESQYKLQSGNQMEMAKYNDGLKQQAENEKLFLNPLGTHMKTVEDAQKSGMTFTPEQNQTVEDIKKEIQSIQNSLATGESSRATVLPRLREKVAQLNSITPSQRPPPTTFEQIQKDMVYLDPKTGSFSQTPIQGGSPVYMKRNKDGTYEYKGIKEAGGPGDQEMIDVDGKMMPLRIAKDKVGVVGAMQRNAKQVREGIENQFQAEWGRQMVAEYGNPALPKLSADPNWQAQLRARIAHEHGSDVQAAEQGVLPAENEARQGVGLPPKGPDGQPIQPTPQPAQPPAQAATGASPAGPAQPPQQQGMPPPQAAPRIETPQQAEQFVMRLRQKPVAQWSVEEWAVYRRARAMFQAQGGPAA